MRGHTRRAEIWQSIMKPLYAMNYYTPAPLSLASKSTGRKRPLACMTLLIGWQGAKSFRLKP
ncbi:MAG: hypothetical protein BWY09_03220 [Candidatus Hydrogenedentes bacterium ADurb.Bin179]|nr:MAG: hypothetical protein BWY09_03220 [Candidatus Hydrogenedentes bacterium ADurb.Bin179]